MKEQSNFIQTRNDLTAGLRGMDPYLLIIFTFPFFLLVINPCWIYSPRGDIDSWVYFGYFRNLRQHLSDFFPQLYYGTRLPWILPGYLAHLVFAPLLANYILHLTFYFIAVFSLYFILKHTIGRRTALLSAMILGSNVYFLYATGWDYVDGACLAYYLLTMALLTQAAQASSYRTLLFFAGATFAALIHTNLMLLIFSPTFVAYYVYLNFNCRRINVLSSFFAMLKYFVAGAVVLTALLGVANYNLAGDFLFFMPSVRFAFDTIDKANPWRSAHIEWAKVTWLYLPTLIVLGNVAHLARCRIVRKPVNRFILFFSLNFISSFLVMLMLELSGSPTLQFIHCASYLIPPMFLALSLYFSDIDERIEPLHFFFIIFATAILFAIPLTRSNHQVVRSVIERYGLYYSVIISMVIGVIGIICRNLYDTGLNTLIIFLLSLGILNLRSVPVHSGWSAMQDSREQFLRITKCMQAVQSITHDRKPSFWYDNDEPLWPEFRSLASTYLWQWTLINENFPKFTNSYQLKAGMLIVIPSQRHDVVERANGKLGEAKLQGRLVKKEEIAEAGVSYTLTFLELERIRAASNRPLRLGAEGLMNVNSDVAHAATFPLDRWSASYPGAKMNIKMNYEGLHVTTAKPRWAYATMYPKLTASVAGEYEFQLRYRLLAGGMAFGALAEDRSKWLAQAGSPRKEGNTYIKKFSLHLKTGEKIVLLTTNDHPIGDKASSYLIQELRVDCTPDQD